MSFTDGLTNNLSDVFDWNSNGVDTSFTSSGGNFGGADYGNNSNPTGGNAKTNVSQYSSFGAGLQELFKDPGSFFQDLATIPWINPVGAAANSATGGALEGTYGGPSNPLPAPPPKTWIEGLANGLGISAPAMALIIYGGLGIVGLFAIGYAIRSVR